MSVPEHDTGQYFQSYYYILLHILFFHPLRYGAGGSKDETERKTRKITDNKRCFIIIIII